MSAIELLSSVLGKTGDLIEGVPASQSDDPTPCPDYDVAEMVDHLVGWVRSFDAAANGRTFEGDPGTFKAGDDPAGQFRSAAESMVAGWRDNGLDRMVSIAGGDTPGEMAFNMTLMEYLTHGWDLAVATGQTVLYSDAEAEQVLTRAEGTLPPQYRGEGMPFGQIVPVPDDAPAIDRLIGFMGRDPAATR